MIINFNNKNNNSFAETIFLEGISCHVEYDFSDIASGNIDHVTRYILSSDKNQKKISQMILIRTSVKITIHFMIK